MPYKTLEHTADLGVEVCADSLEGLFVEAAKAMFSEIAGGIEDIEPAEEVKLQISGETLEDLLVGWLSDLLFYFDVAKFLFSQFSVEINPDQKSLEGAAMGERIDEEKHTLKAHIKAVTYHQMKIEQRDGQWRTTIIFDT